MVQSRCCRKQVVHYSGLLVTHLPPSSRSDAVHRRAGQNCGNAALQFNAIGPALTPNSALVFEERLRLVREISSFLPTTIGLKAVQGNGEHKCASHQTASGVEIDSVVPAMGREQAEVAAAAHDLRLKDRASRW